MKDINLKTVLKKIEEHRWWSEEAPGVYNFIGWPLRAFVEQGKYGHPKYLSVSIFIYRDDFFYEETPADEKLKVYNYIYDKTTKDKFYLKKIRKNSERTAVNFFKAAKKLEKGIIEPNNLQLVKLYEEFYQIYLDYMRRAVITECVDIFSSENLPALIGQENPSLNINETLAIAIAMSAPLKLSFIEEEELLLFKGAVAGYKFLSFKKKIDINQIDSASLELKSIISRLVENYFWIGNNFQRAVMLDKKYFFEQMRELVESKSKEELMKEINNFETKISRLKQEKKNLSKRYHFSKSLQKHFYILQESAAWIDDRKLLMTKANYYCELFCREIAKKFNLNLWLVKQYSPPELKVLLLNNKKVPNKIIAARQHFLAQVVIRGQGWHCRENFFYGKQAKIIFDAFFKNFSSQIIKGQVASAPTKLIKGRVQIILDIDKKKFKPGNILVTTMTRPEFVPLMRQAKAIITDEGGLTCHAAIVSRELGKLCIIGTKIATKILKDGDLVQIDANQGIVRKIKK